MKAEPPPLDEILDEGGIPYFEPLNWDMLNKKYAGGFKMGGGVDEKTANVV